MSAKGPGLGDVRMRGFTRRAEVDTAWQWIDRHTPRLGSQVIDTEQAAGRILASEVVAAIDVPAFDRSAMDGYALRGEETIGASEYNPLTFRVIGQALPGQRFDGSVLPGQAVRIMTGAPMPDGADAVVPAEYARETATGAEIAMAFGPGKERRTLGRGHCLWHFGAECRPAAAPSGSGCGRIVGVGPGRSAAPATGAHRRHGR